jgi:hypothetical protein
VKPIPFGRRCARVEGARHPPTGGNGTFRVVEQGERQDSAARPSISDSICQQTGKKSFRPLT